MCSRVSSVITCKKSQRFPSAENLFVSDKIQNGRHVEVVIPEAFYIIFKHNTSFKRDFFYAKFIFYIY